MAKSLRSRSEPPAPVALVTGGARRIGREIALALAADGWNIAVHYGRSRRDAERTVREIESHGRSAVAVECALDDERAVRTLIGRATRALGPVFCLVNNASLFEFDDAATFSAARLARLIGVNAAAPIVLARAVAEKLAPGGRLETPGVVINVLDQKLANPNPDFLSYTLSKAALAEATRLLAMALAPHVRVVGVAPGLTLPSGAQSEANFRAMHRRTPLGAGNTSSDIANAVVYLARARAVTGVTLLVDGGQHLVPSARDVMFNKK